MPTYPTYKLGEIIDKVPIEFKVKQKEYLSNGKFPVVDQGQDLIGGFVDDESLLVKTELPVIVFGDHTKAKKFIDFPFVAGADGTKIIKPKKEFFIEPKLFYWFLHCVKFPDKGYARHFQYLLNSDIAVPPLPTQQAIVARIEALFAELDKAAKHLRTAQQQLKTYRQAVLNHWLNNDDGKWEMVPIKEIISVISNGSTPKADKMFSKGEIQFLKVYNLNFDGSINLSKEPVFIERDTHETLLKRSQTKQGDVLINIVGPPLGKVSIIPEGEKEYNINQAIVMFRPNEFVTSKFLAYYLMSPQVIAWLTSTSKATAGQYNVKVSTCREIMFPKISISDQHRIGQEIESRLSQAEAAEASIAEALQKTEALRQSILKKAFSGELV